MSSQIVRFLYLVAQLVGLPYGAGMIPLFFALPGQGTVAAWLTANAAGLLLGTGLGIIIPEGVEVVIKANNPEGSLGYGDFPTTTIAISLLVGFTFTLVTEQLLPGPYSPVPKSRSPSTVDAGVELEDLKVFVSASAPRHPTTRTVTGDGSKISVSVPVSGKSFALALGLVLHALSDGLALGSSIVADADSGVVIFGVLAFLRALTALGLTTTLLENGVNRADCKKFLATYSIATPVCATLAGYILWFLRSADGGNSDWTGIAMLVSGGSFLYVPVVLQPVGGDACVVGNRSMYFVWGMFTPQAIRAICWAWLR